MSKKKDYLKIKIESLHKNVEGSGDKVLTTAHTKVYEEDTGQVLGCIQKLTYTIDVQDFVPRAVIEVVNLPIEVESVHAEVEPVMFGPDLKRLDDMSQDEIVEALKWEAKQRYLLNLQLVDLKFPKEE
jgi:hypothetical protein